MSYLKLLNARRKGGKQPTMPRIEFSKQQEERAARGDCIQCGNRKADRNSYVCNDCQAEETIEDIRNDINALRRKILGRTGGAE